MNHKETQYHLQLIELMNDFLQQDVSGEYGWISEETATLMADAALNVLKAVKAANDFCELQLTPQK